MTSVRFCALALSFFAVAQATLTLTNVSVIGNGTSIIHWSSSDSETDPTLVSVELTNPSFHTQFGVGSDVPVSNGLFMFETPDIIPGPDYTIQLINISNANDVLAQSSSFTVTENDVKSSTTSGSSATASSNSTLSLPTSNPALTASSSQTGAPSSVTQPGSSSSGSASFSAPPSSSSNPVFGNGGGGNGANGLQASLALGLVGVAFAFL